MDIRKLKLSSRLLFLYIFLSLLFSLFIAGISYVLKFVITYISKNENTSFWIAMSIMVFLMLIISLIFVVKIKIDKKLELEIEVKLKREILKNNSHAEYSSFSDVAFKNNLLFNSKKIVVSYYKSKIDIISSILAMLLSFIILSLLSWIIALLSIGFNLLSMIFVIWTRTKISTLKHKYSKNREKFIEDSSVLFNGYFDFFTFKKMNVMEEKFKIVNNNLFLQNKKNQTKEIWFSWFLSFLQIFSNASIILFIAFFSNHNMIDAFNLIPIISINTIFVGSFNNIETHTKSIQSNDSLIKILNKKYIKSAEIKNNEIKVFPIKIKDLILQSKNNNIKFKDLTIKYGEKLNIVGDNGTGKTLFLKSVMGVYPIKKGKIIYGENKNQINMTTFFNKSIYLSNNPFIFYGSLLDNLFIKKEDYKKIEKEYNFLTKIFDSPTQQAKKMSLGQKQILALLRALVWKKEFLIIDEGFSAVSKNNVKIIEKYLMLINKTIIYVSHSKNTIFKGRKINMNLNIHINNQKN